MENQVSDTELVNSSTSSAGNSTGHLKAPSYKSEGQNLKVFGFVTNEVGVIVRRMYSS